MYFRLHTNSKGLEFREKRGDFPLFLNTLMQRVLLGSRGELHLGSGSGRERASVWLPAVHPDGTASVPASLATPEARNDTGRATCLHVQNSSGQTFLLE